MEAISKGVGVDVEVEVDALFTLFMCLAREG
jgi:hypothetical protein